MKLIPFVFILLVFQFRTNALEGQINTFPNVQTFETNNGGWIAGGANSSWQWGAPSKPFITNCGQGTKCWVTSLNGTYNSGELSFIQSPVYDLSSLNYPFVRFKIVWETEFNWDGCALQFSTNGGVSWGNMPYSAPLSCMKGNWYNHATTPYLDFPSNNSSWSGNTSNIAGGGCTNGSGSGGWVNASHCLTGLASPPNLAGYSNVRFRFVFGTGSICNDDGVGIDAFTIMESPNVPDFTFLCGVTNREVYFTGVDIVAGCGLPFTGWSWNWNFGDPLSGANNTSNIRTPMHLFTTDGNYVVTLIATNPCGRPVSIQKLVTVSGLSCILPMEITDFRGERRDDRIELKWKAIEENNLRGYSISKSLDGDHYYKLGEINKSAGNQNSSHYSFPDPERILTPGEYFYQLYKVDENGNEWPAALTRVVVDPFIDLSINLWPSVVNAGDKINLLGQDEDGVKLNFQVFDNSGREIMNGSCEAGNEIQLETSSLASGIYSIVLNNGKRNILARFVIQ